MLGRIARHAVVAIRCVLAVAGVVALVFGTCRTFLESSSDGRAVQALGVVWLCAGLPLLARVDWLFGRGRWVALGVGVVLWTAPALLPDDHAFGFVLRFFASLVACLTLAVWRTIRSLAASAPPAA